MVKVIIFIITFMTLCSSILTQSPIILKANNFERIIVNNGGDFKQDFEIDLIGVSKTAYSYDIFILPSEASTTFKFSSSNTSIDNRTNIVVRVNYNKNDVKILFSLTSKSANTVDIHYDIVFKVALERVPYNIMYEENSIAERETINESYIFPIVDTYNEKLTFQIKADSGIDRLSYILNSEKTVIELVNGYAEFTTDSPLKLAITLTRSSESVNKAIPYKYKIKNDDINMINSGPYMKDIKVQTLKSNELIYLTISNEKKSNAGKK